MSSGIVTKIGAAPVGVVAVLAPTVTESAVVGQEEDEGISVVVTPPQGFVDVFTGQGKPGEPGPPGPPGPSQQISAIAAVTVSGHRVVRPQADGTVVYADNRSLPDATRALWLTLGAALAGDLVNVQVLGQVTEPGWNWVDSPIFLSINGVLTQTPPNHAAGAAFLIQVAEPDGPTSLFFNPRNPIALS